MNLVSKFLIALLVTYNFSARAVTLENVHFFIAHNRNSQSQNQPISFGLIDELGEEKIVTLLPAQYFAVSLNRGIRAIRPYSIKTNQPFAQTIEAPARQEKAHLFLFKGDQNEEVTISDCDRFKDVRGHVKFSFLLNPEEATERLAGYERVR